MNDDPFLPTIGRPALLQPIHEHLARTVAGLVRGVVDAVGTLDVLRDASADISVTADLAAAC